MVVVYTKCETKMVKESKNASKTRSLTHLHIPYVYGSGLLDIYDTMKETGRAGFV